MTAGSQDREWPVTSGVNLVLEKLRNRLFDIGLYNWVATKKWLLADSHKNVQLPQGRSETNEAWRNALTLVILIRI